MKRHPLFIPIVLIFLSFVPLASVGYRLVDFAFRGETQNNARLFAAWLPMSLHCVFGGIFLVAGALQVAKRARRRWPLFHRRAGMLALPSGILMAASGLWLVAVLAPREGEVVLNIARSLAGGGMIFCLAQSTMALVNREYRRHGRWAFRAFALGMGATTQFWLFLPFIALGLVDDLAISTAIHIGGWTANVLFAEWRLRRQ